MGAWTLASFEVRRSDGETIYPFGPDAKGLLIYDAQGNFSVQVGEAGRPEFTSGDMRDGTDAQVRAACEGYIAYYGTYRVNAEQGYLVHEVRLSLFPNWSGQVQKRYYDLSADRLTLTTPPTPFGEAEVVGVLTWKRVDGPR